MCGRVVGVASHGGAAGGIVEVHNCGPGLAAVAGGEKAALGVRPVGVAERGDEDNVGIRGMHNHRADVP